MITLLLEFDNKLCFFLRKANLGGKHAKMFMSKNEISYPITSFTNRALACLGICFSIVMTRS